MRKRAIVVSDLHLGPEGPLATFRDDAALASFVGGLGERREPPTELVLAGDVFDFLQTTGYDGFRADLAEERFAKILERPETKRVVAAIKEFASSPGCEVTLLAGNHDPEVLVPAVREAFARAIDCVGRVRFADDTTLIPRGTESWPVMGRTIETTGGAVWITHGDAWDPHNAIDRPALVEAIKEGTGVKLPPGSQLVYKVLAQLQPDYQWIPELKPELPVVFPLLLYLDPERTWAFIKENTELTTRLLVGSVQGALHAGPLFGQAAPLDAAEALSSIESGLVALLSEGIRREPDPDALLAQLEVYIEKGAVDGDGTLAEHGGARRALLRAWLSGARFTSRFGQTDADDGVVDRARRRLPDGLAALIAGHTHGPRALPMQHPAYYNSGTWIPVGELPEGPIELAIDAVEAGSWTAKAPRSFVSVEWGDGPPEIRTGAYRGDGVRWGSQHD